MKRTFYSEMAYLLGLVTLALGTALMERANFGMSMVVAPAYILHLKLGQTFPAFTFGMAEYCLQAVLIVLMSLMLRRFRLSYLFSFVTAVIYGFVLDAVMALIALLPADILALRVVMFVSGMAVCSVGVALLFHTYFAPEAYELMVKELAAKTNISIAKVKTAYDLISLMISVVLSFAFFGLWHFEGVKLGTLITALVNGWMIGRISAWLDSRFDWKDKLGLRRIMEV